VELHFFVGQFRGAANNCWFACTTWGLGVEINGDVKTELVKSVILTEIFKVFIFLFRYILK
jgi:hypothetical protein